MKVVGGGVFLSILVSFFVFLLPLGDYGRLFSFNRTIQFFPFFYTGYLLKQRGIVFPFIMSKLWRNVLLVVSGVSVLILLFLPFFSTAFTAAINNIEFYNIDVWLLNGGHGFIVLSLLIFGRVLLIPVSIVLSSLILSQIRFSNRFAQFGSSTLVVYVVQGVLAHIGSHMLPDNLFIELLLAIFILCFSIVLIKKTDTRYITNPLSSIIKNRFKYII